MEITIKEYGHVVTVSRRMLHYTMGYVCPDKDICNICNYVPAPITSKQKRRKLWRKVKWHIGRPFGLLALKLGYTNYYPENGDDND